MRQLFLSLIAGLFIVSSLYSQSNGERVEPILEVYPCSNGYEWSVWLDYNGDGLYDHKLFRTCDSILGVWYEGETVWDQVVNHIRLVEVGSALPILVKEELPEETVWYVAERDSVLGRTICRSTISDEGHPTTDCIPWPMTSCGLYWNEESAQQFLKGKVPERAKREE